MNRPETFIELTDDARVECEFRFAGNDDTRSVFLDIPPFSRIDPEKFEMRNRGSHEWSIKIGLPTAARFSYCFTETKTNGEVIRHIGERRGIVETDGVSAASDVSIPADAPRGTLRRRSIRSERLRQERPISEYRTPDLSSGDPKTLLIFFDADIYLDEVRTVELLDSLFFRGLTKRTAAIFIEQLDRENELILNADFAAFVADELVTGREAISVIVVGSSFGGIAALYTAAAYPERFSGVIAQSVSLWRCRDRIDELIPKQRSYPIHLSWGEFEGVPRHGTTIRDANREFFARLASDGHEVIRDEYRGAHGAPNWREPLISALEIFIREKIR